MIFSSFLCQFNRGLIVDYLNAALSGSTVLRTARPGDAVSFRLSQATDVHEREMEALRRMVDVLFIFYCQKPSDSALKADLTEWISLLFSSILSVATLDDHLFIITHIARWGGIVICLAVLSQTHRCRSGAGAEFARFIQLPAIQSWADINHIVAMLNCLFLAPVCGVCYFFSSAHVAQ